MEVFNEKKHTCKLRGHFMSEYWYDNTENGSEFHDDQIDGQVVVVLNKSRQDYNFHGKLSHSYIQTFHKVSPFDDAMWWKSATIQWIYFDALMVWGRLNTEFEIPLLYFYII